MSPARVPPRPENSHHARLGRQVSVGSVVGLVAAAIGVVLGLIVMLPKEIIECPDGKTWPEGATDLTCYTHPHLLEGTGLALFSLMAGILIWITSVIALTLLEDKS